jgi:hypothetical protein
MRRENIVMKVPRPSREALSDGERQKIVKIAHRFSGDGHLKIEALIAEFRRQDAFLERLGSPQMIRERGRRLRTHVARCRQQLGIVMAPQFAVANRAFHDLEEIAEHLENKWSDAITGIKPVIVRDFVKGVDAVLFENTGLRAGRSNNRQDGISPSEFVLAICKLAFRGKRMVGASTVIRLLDEGSEERLDSVRLGKPPRGRQLGNHN